MKKLVVECSRNKIKDEMERRIKCSTAYFEEFKLDRLTPQGTTIYMALNLTEANKIVLL